jgi:hypothetical protein
MLAGVTLAMCRENAAGHTHEVIICAACLGMGAGPKPRALSIVTASAAWTPACAAVPARSALKSQT